MAKDLETQSREITKRQNEKNREHAVWRKCAGSTQTQYRERTHCSPRSYSSPNQEALNATWNLELHPATGRGYKGKNW